MPSGVPGGLEPRARYLLGASCRPQAGGGLVNLCGGALPWIGMSRASSDHAEGFDLAHYLQFVEVARLFPDILTWPSSIDYIVDEVVPWIEAGAPGAVDTGRRSPVAV